MGLSAERQIGRSRSAHMLWKSYRRTGALASLHFQLSRFYDDEQIEAVDFVNVAVAQSRVLFSKVRLQQRHAVLMLEEMPACMIRN